MSRNTDPAKKNELALLDLLKIDSNKFCADCGQKGTRWASWNIGVFLCIRCGGLHRALGTHISKVKSVTLDKWTDEQVESIRDKGNAKVNMTYNPHPDRHPFPSFSGDMENYIRDKYERRLFMDETFRKPAIPKTASAASTNLMDMETVGVANDTFASLDRSQYAKQLVLLTEMGFHDTDFNLKTLRAANGNMQETLEILVAANQKLRKQSTQQNLFDQVEAVRSPKIEPKAPLDDVDSLFARPVQSPPPANMDDWSRPAIPEAPKSAGKNTSSRDEHEALRGDVSSDDKPRGKQAYTGGDPWSGTVIEPENNDDGADAKEDKSASSSLGSLAFNPFKDTTSGARDFFDNPW